MPFNKVQKPVEVSKTDQSQSLFAPEALQQQNEIEEVLVSEEEFQSIMSSIMESQRAEGNAIYNSVLDEEVFVEDGVSITESQAKALKLNNRKRVLEYQEELATLKEAYIKAMEEAGISISYDPEEYEAVFDTMQLLFNTDVAEISTSQYGVLKETQKKLAISESKIITDKVSFNEVASVSEGSVSVSIAASGEIDLEDVSMIGLTSAISLYEEGSSENISQGIPLGAALGMGYDSILEAEEMNNGVIQTLGKVDENTSYIESLMLRGAGDSINIETAGRPEEFTFEEIWENCFDCFADAWGKPLFTFGLGIEIRAGGLLDVIKDLIKSIKYAIDIQGIIASNMCSLMRIGILCPIEIAFLTASLVSLLRFTITEVALGFKDFLLSLISAILLPLLNALEATASFGIAPLNAYTGCVLRTLLSTEQVSWTGRFTKAQIADILNIRETERVSEIPREDRERLRVKSRNWDKKLRAKLLNAGVNSLDANKSQFDLSEILGIANVLDPIEMLDGALLESNEKLSNSYLWIKNGLGGLKNFARSKSIKRMELVAKIVALSTLIGVVIAIGRLLAGDIEICDEITDRETGERIIEPRFTPEEFLDIIGIPTLLELELLPKPDTDTIIVDGEEVSNNVNSSLVNTVTQERFSIINCEKGKVRKVSKLELQATLQQLGLS